MQKAIWEKSQGDQESKNPQASAFTWGQGGVLKQKVKGVFAGAFECP